MGKINISLDDAYDDFGFSAVSEDELKSMERQLQQQVLQTEKQLTLTSKEYKDRMEALYKLIMPLLLNLQKDNNKSYIYWPDRSEKIGKLIIRIDEIIQD